MTRRDKPLASVEVIEYLKRAIADGQHWYLALLEAMGLWDTAEEIYQKRSYRYLIAEEAFDWLLLAERLCQTVDGRLPDNEKTALLVHGKPPLDLPADKFKELIGIAKYHQYLNYFYGITVEEALILAVEAEIRKERRAYGYWKETNIDNEAYRRIYGATKAILLRQFRREKKLPQRQSTSLTELKEFSYWLFKYRLKHGEKARVASDTKKALNWLKKHDLANKPDSYDLAPDFFEISPATATS